MSVYDIGQEVRYWGTFSDTAGAATDPGTVNFYWQPPGGPGTYYGYNSGSTVIRQNTGTYYIDQTYQAGGYARYRWEGTGALQTATQGRDFVRYLGTQP